MLCYHLAFSGADAVSRPICFSLLYRKPQSFFVFWLVFSLEVSRTFSWSFCGLRVSTSFYILQSYFSLIPNQSTQEYSSIETEGWRFLGDRSFQLHRPLLPLFPPASPSPVLNAFGFWLLNSFSPDLWHWIILFVIPCPPKATNIRLLRTPPTEGFVNNEGRGWIIASRQKTTSRSTSDITAQQRDLVSVRAPA